MKTVRRGDDNFEATLDHLAQKYKGCAGGPETEVIVNWNKEEVTQTNCVAFYATNKELAKAIERGREAIMEVHPYGNGATLYFDAKRVRPLYTVIRPSGTKTHSNLPKKQTAIVNATQALSLAMEGEE